MPLRTRTLPRGLRRTCGAPPAAAALLLWLYSPRSLHHRKRANIRVL